MQCYSKIDTDKLRKQIDRKLVYLGPCNQSEKNVGEKCFRYCIGEHYQILLRWPYPYYTFDELRFAYLTVEGLLDYAEYLSVYIKI